MVGAILLPDWLHNFNPYVLPLKLPGGIWLSDWLPGDIAINRGRDGPMNVGEARYDESPYHCRDMAGNGREWTRDLFGSPPRFVPLENPVKTDSVNLRGQRYNMRLPWLFQKVDRDDLEVDSYLEPSPYYGFRVVVELN
jgi:hypothetical protein